MHDPALSQNPTNALVPARTPLGRSFDDIRAEAAARGDLALPDVVAPFRQLRATPEGNIAAPGGELALTDWSRRQLARTFGIRWEHWFDESRVSPVQRAQDLN